MFDLAGKTALVTGGSGGMGAEVAKALGRQGATVAVGYHSDESAAESVVQSVQGLGGQAQAVGLDATDPMSISRIVQQVRSEHGAIDVLAVCHGWHGEWQLFSEQDPRAWEEVVNLYLLGTLHLCQALLPEMIERRSGRVIVLTGDGAKAGESGAVVANAVLGALNSLVKGLAREVARHQVTTNSVCPGPVEGRTFENLMAADGIAGKIARALPNVIPMKRLGKPEEIAAVFAFLASDEAGHITGQNISVSGGLTMQ